MARLASTGFRDVSRLASGEPDLARGISLTNQAGLLHWIDAYLTVLLDWRKALTEDPERLLDAMGRAREARDKWLAGRMQRAGEQFQEIPSAGEQMAEMFMGGRLARTMREQNERLKQMEQGGGRRPPEEPRGDDRR
jgi:prephenate dehydrogenase